MNQDKKSVQEVDQILDLISSLKTRITLNQDLSCISDEQFDRIVENVQSLKINIYNHKLFSEPTKDRLEELTDIMTSIAQLDFTKKAPVGDEENHLDYIAIGLNLLSYQLNKKITPILNSADAFESLQLPFIIVDKQSNVRSINKQGVITLGRKQEEITGKKIYQILDESQGKPVLILSNGYRQPIAVHKAVFKNENGTESGYTYLCLPATETKETTSFIGNKIDLLRIHHDVTNPVKNIRELVKIGKSETTNSATRKLFDLIDKCRHAIENHLKDLFDILFMRLEPAKSETIDLKILVHTLISQLSHYPRFEEIEFKTSYIGDKKISSDKKLISSILQNLIENAVKYSKPDGSPVISISIRISEKKLKIEVKDNGVGIEKSDLPEIFKPHYRATTLSDGKGLGLYIVKEAVEKLGGETEVASFRGKGSAFKVILPLST